MEEEEKEGEVGGYSQFQSESNCPATITSAVIMNTLFIFFRPGEQSRSLNVTFLWLDVVCLLTPPAAPSSGDP